MFKILKKYIFYLYNGFFSDKLQQQDNARKMLYQNSGYQFERRDKKTLILDIEDTATY